jgi:PAS domain S-box-containing protein
METLPKSLRITAIATAVLILGVLAWLVVQPASHFIPQGQTYSWNTVLLCTNVLSDLLTGCAYIAISTTLAYLVTRARRDLPFHWLFVSFGAFIIACGITRFTAVWNVWHGDYWLSALLKVVITIASVTTAILLPRRIPAILALLETRRAAEIHKQNLTAEIQQRVAAEVDLLKMKANLEQLIRGRTSELSQANSALSLYETIFKTSAWGVAIADSVRGLIQLANPAFARMHGYSADEMIGMPMSATFAPEYVSKVPNMVDIVNAQDHLMYESVHVRKDQTRFACLTDVTLARDPQGLPLYRFGYFQDISSQKRAEEDIRNVITHARCILWRAIVTGGEGWETYRSGGSRFTWDLTVQDEVAAHHFMPLLIQAGGNYSQAFLASRHPGDLSAIEETTSRAFIRGSRSYSLLYRCFDKFGEIVWIREDVAVSQVSLGKWECTGVCMDVSDEHRLNEQIRQQAELLELSHDAIIVRNAADEIIYWNSGAEDLYGWHRDEVIGKNIHDLLATRTPREEFNRALRQQGYWAGQLHHTSRDGRGIVVDSRHLLVHRGDGEKVVLETNHDITSWSPAGSEAEAFH